MSASTSSERARRLLACCLAGAAPDPAEVRALAREGSGALLRIVVEGLADRFEPALCDVYADLMAEAIAEVSPGLDAAALAARYRRIRLPRPCAIEPRTVFVLSRVTLGADVAVTSVLLDAAKRRFPHAEIVLAGPRKNWELFSADSRVKHLPVSYPRGTLAERLTPWQELRREVDRPEAIVIDADSRLTQLGLLPVCGDERYFFFESRGYGGAGEDALPALASRWAAETFGVEGAAPYIAVPGSAVTDSQPLTEPRPQRSGPGPTQPAHVAVSLGVGENPAKRIPDPFEERLLQMLGERFETLWIDRGAGGEEAGRVDRAIRRSGLPAACVRTWEGSFAGFASLISRAKLYVGYDSAGQHVAAACGVPLVSVFAGFPVPRMFYRWRPAGAVIRVDDPAPEAVLRKVAAALP